MLRSLHKFIAEKIANELCFTTENTHIFIDGSLGPDTHGDFPHKTGKNSKILQRIDEARELYFFNDEYSYGKLGNALHYIQDKWVDNYEVKDEATFTVNDALFLKNINLSKTPQKTKTQYQNIANTLLNIKNSRLDEWFNHSWGIWHKDYASCIYVFADITELMLPTLQPNTSITNDKTKLKQYVHSEAFVNATKEGFLCSIITNYLYPKIQGYPAAMYSLAMVNPPSDNSYPEIDLQIVYRLSLEIARYTLAKPEQFKHKDAWTHKTQDNHLPMGLLKPQYLDLISKPTQEVVRERLTSFYGEKQKFLEAWPAIEEAFPQIKRSETWKILLTGLVEILKIKEN